MEKNIRKSEYYVDLLEECKAIKVEREYNSRIEIINGKWELGEKIVNSNEDLERKKIYGKGIIEALSIDLVMSASDLWACCKFYKKYRYKTFSDVSENLPEGKNISWYMITREYLGDDKNEQKSLKRKVYKTEVILGAFEKFIIDHGFARGDIQNLLKDFEDKYLNNF